MFITSAGAKPVEVKCKAEDLQIDLEAFEKAITKNTKAVVVNSPNNPSGVVINEETVKGLCDILRKKQEEYGKEIFLVSDENGAAAVELNLSAEDIDKTISYKLYEKNEGKAHVTYSTKVYEIDITVRAHYGKS